jgi:hypothetical protein
VDLLAHAGAGGIPDTTNDCNDLSTTPRYTESATLRAAWPGALLICVHGRLAGAAALDRRGRVGWVQSTDNTPWPGCVRLSAPLLAVGVVQAVQQRACERQPPGSQCARARV